MKYFKIKALKLHALFNTEQAISKVRLFLANATVIFFASVNRSRNFPRKENKQNESKPTNKQLTDEVFSIPLRKSNVS